MIANLKRKTIVPATKEQNTADAETKRTSLKYLTAAADFCSMADGCVGFCFGPIQASVLCHMGAVVQSTCGSFEA